MTAPVDLPQLEGFTFIRLLGRGGMASVWEARQHEPDRVVAIKILNDDISSSPEDVESFYAEAKRAAELDHENIVTVFEVGCQNGHYYYVMELAAGYDTGRWLRRKGQLKPEDVLTIAESVAVALDYAVKTLGIIHCDIKPGNIMVDGDGTVRLTDLGIARFVRGPSQDDDYVCGTPAFMSPEQATGEELDVRADIYSLGATIYNLVTGRRLFEGRPDDAVMDAQCHEQVSDLRDLNPSVTYPFAVLVSQMLAKNRALRPMSWAVVIRDMQRVRQGLMPLGRIPAEGESTMRLNPVSESDAAVASRSATTLEPTRKMKRRERLTRMSGKSRRGLARYIALTALAAIAAFFAAYFITCALL